MSDLPLCKSLGFDEYVKTVLTEIKAGIDAFNKDSENKALYPEWVDIEHCGIKISIPIGKTNE